MNVSPVTWNALSALLDEALDLAEPARGQWLDRLTAEQPDLAPAVRKLLAAHASSETADVLARLPAIAPGEIHAGGLAAGQRIGPYRLLRELGAGGMADVWLAERADGAFTRAVALKLPHLNRLRRDLALRFARERDILARLEHPHIARLYDAGVDADGLPYLAMEYVDGQPITIYCDARRLDIRARLALFDQVLDAVQYAHANLVIHRDLKPSNILVTADGQMRLLDFGIAKLLADDDMAQETQLTQLSGRALTPDYASPEQIKGEPLTIATDVYSLGVVLYELLVGSRPYKLKLQSPAQLEQAIVTAEPARPSGVVEEPNAQVRGATAKKLARALAGDLDTIVLKTLSKEPHQRYATTAEFKDDLNRYSLGKPVHARPATFAYRAGRFALRHKLETAIGAAAAIALVGGAYAQVAIAAALAAGGGVALWQVRIARRQAKLAREQAQRAEEVKRFVLSFFEDADTDRGGGNRNTTALDLLRQARDRLQLAPISDEAIRVELLTTIGAGLHGFGELDLARKALTEAAQRARASADIQEPIAAEANRAYGFLLYEAGDLKGASMHLDAAETSMRRLGRMAGLAAVLDNKSRLRESEANYDAAIELARQAVDAAQAQTPVDERSLIAALIQLVHALVNAERMGALDPARRAYHLAQRFYGARPTRQALSAQTMYVAALANEAEPTVAQTELRSVLERQIEMFGPRHVVVGETLGRIGVLYMALGDPAAGTEALRRAVDISQSHSHGAPTPDLAAMRINLGAQLANARKYEEALAEWRTADELFTALYDRNCEAARVARSGAAFALTQLGRLDEADAVFASLLERPFSSPMEKSFVNNRLSLLRSAQGRHGEAEALLRDVPDFYANAPKGGRLRALALSDLGKVLLAGGKPADSLAALLEARSLLREYQRNGSPDLAEISLGIARAQLALGHASDAATHAADAAEFWRRFDPARRETGIAASICAQAQAAAADANRPAEVLRQASKTPAAAGRPADPALLARARGERKTANP